MNIVKTGFFLPLKGQKNRNAFANFCYSSHRDDFYIPIPARPLKAGPTRPNASEEITPKPGLHKPKDRQRFEISKGVTTGKDSFRDPSSWESTERGPRIPEDRPCIPVESQKMTVEHDETPIDRLD